MYANHTIAVVVPAFNEEKLIGRVIETMPDFVDKIIAVDDNSSDRTAQVVNEYKKIMNGKLTLINHQINEGVGGAIVSGYNYAMKHQFDVAVVMAGDAQMDPTDLPRVLNPIVMGRADFAKGNRFLMKNLKKNIPLIRRMGISVLAAFSRIASGFWHLSDFQCGYTAIKYDLLKKINLEKVYKRYGMPNDFLSRLKTVDARVVEVPVKPVYNIGEKTGIKYHRDIPIIMLLLMRSLFRRFSLKLKGKTSEHSNPALFLESFQL